ncbi:centromere protein F [Protopterus annectens]|uniref:centromere protein F n=1 Tax=Protopterus annectens TaxID=7888 RepID=UPI001CFBDE88|nr:centromere protein F [Protopterus annectens]
MSWATEEWKEGLPTKALQKIQEMETQVNKLVKERQQRQFQMDSLEAALQKQKQKVESEKNEMTALKRENQSLTESCDNLEKLRQKISHDLQVKEAQINFLDGQLSLNRKQIEKLELEIKKTKSEAERSQQALLSGEMSICSTPQKVVATSIASDLNNSRLEELQEKYNKEVEERKRLESRILAMEAKEVNLAQPQNKGSHRAIARQQFSSSVFPWHQERTPTCQAANMVKTPVKRGIAASSFPWEQEESPRKRGAASRLRSLSGDMSAHTSPQMMDHLRKQNKELAFRVGELEESMQEREKETKNHLNRLQEVQLQFEKAKAELSEKDGSLSKCREELNKVTAQLELTNTKCATLEQKLKQVSEELRCQRQNADIARLAVEQKLKDKEREYQQELCQQQSLVQSMEQESSQMKAKLSQELQQAKRDNCVLQSEIDKVTAQKQQLDREMDNMKHNLYRTEQSLQTSQAKESDLKKSLEEMVKERSTLSSQGDHFSKQVLELKEELKTAKENLKSSQNLVEEMKDKNAAQEMELKSLRDSLENDDKALHLEIERLKQIVSDLEKKRHSAQELLQKQELDLEQMQKEMQDLKKTINMKDKETEELKNQNQSLSEWKHENEKLISNSEDEKEKLYSKICELENVVERNQCVYKAETEMISTLEDEKEKLNLQINNLKNVLANKTREMEIQSCAYKELQEKSQCTDLKYGKEIENMMLQISELTSQITDLERNRQVEKSEFESASELLKAKESVIEHKDTEILNLQSNLCTIEQELTKVKSENEFLKEQEKSLLLKIDQAERAKCDAEESLHELAVLREQVLSLESSLKMQKHMHAELEIGYEQLQIEKTETEASISVTVKKHEDVIAHMSKEIDVLKETADNYLQERDALLHNISEKDKQIQSFVKEIEEKRAELLSLTHNNSYLETKLEKLSLQSALMEQDEEHSAEVGLNMKNTLQSLEESQTLNLNEALNWELPETSEKLAVCSAIAGEVVTVSANHDQGHQTLMKRCAELENELAELRKKYCTQEESNIHLAMLKERSSEVLEVHSPLEQQPVFTNNSVEYLNEIIKHEAETEDSTLEVGKMQSVLKEKSLESILGEEMESDHLQSEVVYSSMEVHSYREVSSEHGYLKQQSAPHVLEQIFAESEAVDNDFSGTKNVVFKTEESEETPSLVTSGILESNDWLREKDAVIKLLSDNLKKKENELEDVKVQLQMAQTALKEKHDHAETCSSLRKQKGLDGQELVCVESKTVSSDFEMMEHDLPLKTPDKHDQMSDKSNVIKSEIDKLFHDLKSCHIHSSDQEWSLSKSPLKYEELTKISEALYKEMVALANDLKDSKTQCISLLDERKRMTEELQRCETDMQVLQSEKVTLHSKLLSLKDENKHLKVQTQVEERMTCDSISGEISRDPHCCSELQMSKKELGLHVDELNEKLSALQKEHEELLEQYNIKVKKLSELECFSETRNREGSVFMTEMVDGSSTVEEHGMGTFSTATSGLVDISKQDTNEMLTDDGTNSPSSKIGMASKAVFGEQMEYGEKPSSQVNLSNANPQNESIVLNVSLGMERSESQDQNSQFLCQGYMIKERETAPVQADEVSLLSQENQEHIIQIESEESESFEKKQMESTVPFDEVVQALMDKNKKIEELEQLLVASRSEMDFLSKKHVDEMEEWQQKMINLTAEMEAKLQAEKQQTECLSLELESARLQLQSLDLSSRSLLCTSIDNGHLEAVDLQKVLSSSVETPSELSVDVSYLLKELMHEDSGIEKLGEISRLSNTGHLEITITREESKEAANKIVQNVGCIDQSVGTVVPDKAKLQSVVANDQLLAEHNINQDLHVDSNVNYSDKIILGLNSGLEQQLKPSSESKSCAELEETLLNTETETSHLSNKLILENSELSEKVKHLQNLLEMVSLEQEKYKAEVADMTNALHHLEADTNQWKEKFLEKENEFKRTKSEKENLEKHFLSFEADFEELFSAKCNLENEAQNNLKTISGLHDELAAIKELRNQLTEELSTLVEDKQELEQSHQSLKVKLQELEVNKENYSSFTDVLEAEVKKQAKLLEISMCDKENLSNEKDNLLKALKKLDDDAVQITAQKEEIQQQLNQLNEDKMLLLKDVDALQCKLTAADLEKAKLSQLLESSLFEKGEIAAQLNSAQEEMTQLRSGIEKLKVRIEADQKRSHHTSEKLKASEKRAESLQNKVKSLEKELKASKECLDGVIKADEQDICHEDAYSKIKALEMELDTLKLEKECLQKELQQKQEDFAGIQMSFTNLTLALEQAEIHKTEMAQEHENCMTRLHLELEDMNNKLNICSAELKAWESKEEDWLSKLSCIRNEKLQLSEQLQDAEKENAELQATLKASERTVDAHQDKIEKLERELQLSQENLEGMILQAETVKSLVEERAQEYENSFQKLNLELEDVSEKLTICNAELTTWEAKEQDWLSKLTCLEREKIQLTQQLQESETENADLLEMLKTDAHGSQTEKLERKLQLSENNLDGMILQAETAKVVDQATEQSKLSEKVAAMEAELNAVRLEKQDTEKKLQQKLEEVSELHILCSCVSNDFQEHKEEKTDTVCKSKNNIVQVQLELNEANEKLKMCYADLEMWGRKEQDWLNKISLTEQKNVQLSELLLEAEQKSVDLHSALRVSERKVDSLQDKIERLEREVQMSEENLEMLILQAETAKEAAEEQINENEKLSEKLKSVQMALNAAKIEREELVTQLQKKQEELAVIHMQHSHLENELKQSKEVKAEMLQENENSLRQLQLELEDAKEKLNASCAELESWVIKEQNWISKELCSENEKAQLSKQVEELEARNGELQLTFNVTKAQVDSLQNQTENLEKELQVARKKIEDIIQTKTTDSDVEQNALKRENLCMDLEALQLVHNSLKLEKEELNKELQQSQKEMLALQLEHNSLKLEKEELNKEFQQKQEEMIEMKLSCSQLACQLEQTEKINVKLEECENSFKKSQLELSTVSEKLKICKAELETWASKEQEWISKVSCLEKDKEELAQQLQELKGKNTELQSSLRMTEGQVQSLQDQIKLLEEALQLSKENLEGMCLKASTLQSEADQQAKKHEMISLDFETLTMEHSALKLEKEDLCKELQQKKEEMKEIQASCSHLASELEQNEIVKTKMLQELENSFKQTQLELKDANEKQKICDAELDSWGTKQQEWIAELSCIEKEKTELSEQLRDSERKNAELQSSLNLSEKQVECLQEETEKVKNELQLSKEHLEEMVLKIKTVQSDAEQLATEQEKLLKEIEALQTDCEGFVLKKKDLETLLHQKQEEIAELKMSCSRLTNELEQIVKAKNEESQQFENSSKQLQHELKDIGEKLNVCNTELESWKTKERDWLSKTVCLENENAKLSQQLRESEQSHAELQLSLKLTEEKMTSLEDETERLKKQLQLSKERQEEMVLNTKTVQSEAEQQHERLSKEIETLQMGFSVLKLEKEGLDKQLNQKQEEIAEIKKSSSQVVDELQQSVKEKNKLVQESENSCKQLQLELKDINDKLNICRTELETWKMKEQDWLNKTTCLEKEKAELSEQLQESETRNAELQSAKVNLLHEVQISKEQLLQEKKKTEVQITEEKQLKELILQELSSLKEERDCWEKEKGSMQLVHAEKDQQTLALTQNNATLQATITGLENSLKDLEEQLEMAKSQTSALEAKHEAELQEYQKKVASLEQRITDQTIEISDLKSCKEQLNSCYKEAEKVEELNKAKVENLKSTISRLKKERDSAQGKLQLWMKSCKQLEKDNESLQKQVEEQEEQLSQLQKKPSENDNTEELQSELEEMKEAVEEKSKEADENMEKYCNLIVNYHKLEETHEMLKTRVALLSSQLKKSEPLGCSTNAKSSSTSASPSKRFSDNRRRSPRDHGSGAFKRQRGDESAEDENIENQPGSDNSVPKRVRIGSGSDRILTSAVRGTNEYEPQDLAKDLKKGFADIPSGISSPHILLRASMNTRKSPRLATQHTSPTFQPPSNTFVESSKQAARDRKSQKVNDLRLQSLGSSSTASSIVESPLFFANNRNKKVSFETPDASSEMLKGRPLSSKNPLRS